MSRKEEILEVSAMLIREKGYAGVSMRDLAKAVGMKASSLYNHIPSKQAILVEIILQLAEDFTSQMQRITQEESSSIEKLQQIIDHHVELSLQHPHQLALLNHEWMHLEGEALQTFKKLRNYYEESLRQLINQGKINKELQALHTELILFSMLSTLRNLNNWIKKRGTIPAEQLKTELHQVLLKGVIYYR